MGLYDELEVQYPLPDGWEPGAEVFQPKDTPEQYLLRYVLDAEGTLREKATGEAVPYHGALTFYADNVCASGPSGFATHDDQPPWWAEYTCLYDHGRLLKIEGSKGPQTGLHGPHLTRAEWYAQHRKAGEQTAEAPTRTIEGLTPDEERLRQALGAGQTLPAPYGQGWLEHPPPGS